MTTWTREQVARVKALHVAMDFDPEVFVRMTEDQAISALRSEMIPRLVDMGHPLGVEIAPEDCIVEVAEADHRRWNLRAICAWSPRTDAVELRGGQEDGQVYAIRKVGEPLRVPVVSRTPWMMDADATSATAALTPMALTYEFSGEWSEDNRRWIYDLT